jgi:dihydroxyacid dehydratase/phosphogluconate dehydratase
MGALKTSKLPSRRLMGRAARAPHRCRDEAEAAGGKCERLNVAICALSAAGAPRKASTPTIGGQNLENVKFNIDQKVVYFVSVPISGRGGAVGRRGSLAPNGAIAKVAEMTELPFPAPANRQQKSLVRTFADQVEPARTGVVSHAGGRAKVCL